MDEIFVLRIEDLVEKAGGQTALARKSGLSLGAVQRYLRGGDPSRRSLMMLAEACDVTINWLVYGKDDETGRGKSDSSAVPLFGFGDSSEQGWFHEVEYNIKTALEWPDPEKFAIAAPDNSMAPEGIGAGHVCIVSPNTEPRKNDVVFIRRKDKTASLKIYEREDSEWLYVGGYMDTGDDAEPVASKEQVKKSAVRQTGVVVMVKRR